MNLLTPRTQLDLDLAAKDAGVLRGARAVHGLAAALRAENARFWSLPTERLLAVLNANVAQTLATFAANTAASEAINGILDSLGMPELSGRAPTAPGRTDILFDGAAFVHVPGPEPEPEPPTEPGGESPPMV